MKTKPVMVKIGMLGIKTRKAAQAYFFSSIFGSVLLGAATTAVFVSILDSSLITAAAFGIICGGIFSLSSLWYWLCIAWMDKNSGWENVRVK